MAEDYKGQFQAIKKEYGLPIKEIKALDAAGKLERTLEYLDSIKNKEAAGVSGFKTGGLSTKKYMNPVKVVDNRKKKK
jgi:hypothetical protein